MQERTLNPRVRGSSPWRRTRSDLGFHHPRSFFACPFCPRVCSMFARAHAPCISGLVKNGRSGTDFGGTRHRIRAASSGRCHPASARAPLDQWSRPSRRPSEARPQSPIPMASRSVRPTGKRHSHSGCIGGANAPGTLLACQGCAGRRQCACGRRTRLPPTFEALIRWALPSVRA